MKSYVWTWVVLSVSGVIAAAIGAAGLFWPVAFHATSGIELGGNQSLMSELRAPAASLLLAGLFILISAFNCRLHVAGALVSLAVYASYGAARVLSFALDGAPHSILVQAATLELVVAALCATVLMSALRRT